MTETNNKALLFWRQLEPKDFIKLMAFAGIIGGSHLLGQSQNDARTEAVTQKDSTRWTRGRAEQARRDTLTWQKLDRNYYFDTFGSNFGE